MRGPDFVLVGLLAAGCGEPTVPEPPPGPAAVVDGVRFETGGWTHDLPSGEKGASMGYHRALVEIDSAASAAPAVLARIPWRRPDANPGAKDVLVIDADDDRAVADRLVVSVTNDEGVVVFRPNPGHLTYHVYYLPYETGGGYYPSVAWRAPRDTADPGWTAAARAGLAPEGEAGQGGQLPGGRVTAVQWQDDFHSFFPMQVAATETETASLVAGHPGSFLVFAEDRVRPIRMRDRIPFHWAAAGPSGRFEGAARPGEVYVFQLGVFATGANLEDVRVEFGEFGTPAGLLAASALSSFNTGGIDESGRRFTKRVDVPAGSIQPLWIGIDLPPDRSGRVEGTVTVKARGGASRTLTVSVEVGGPTALDRGFDEPWNQSRLAWLDSRLGDDPDFVIEPYDPVSVDGRALRILGRELRLGDDGLPAAIATFFEPTMTGLGDEARRILAAPIRFEVVRDEGRADRTFDPSDGRGVVAGRAGWVSDPFDVRSVARGRAEWTARSRAPGLEMTVHGALEYDGMLDYRIELTAPSGVAARDMRLVIPYAPEAARWMLGLGRKGGLRPAGVDWKWNVENHQEGVWLGGIDRGLQFVLRDRNYARPLNTNFYRSQPLALPPSWYNEGRGGLRISERESAVEAVAYGGPRVAAPGDTLHFNVRFLVTPFHALDTARHFRTRFVHKYVPIDTVLAWGGTVVNIHHATDINPFINYPFYALADQRTYIDEAHAKGVKVKLYYTIRELTYRAHELFALRSLGDEILNDGEGGGHPWLQEHLGGGYYPAWHAFGVDDAAILDRGTSRWTNYYVEGLAWLAENQRIDGLYLDDIAFSRETVKRMANVLHRRRDEVVIDLHSANQFNVRDGWTNSALLYMEHFPFISRLWFGEYFDYSAGPDYWLTEVSGIPFGLMGEMLQDGGHPYRGLLYGMTARRYGDTDPRPVWRVMSEFGIDRARLLGYWLDRPPVRTGNPDILATTYVNGDRALVALASWAAADTAVALEIDWAALGLSGPAARVLRAPAVEGLQEAADFEPGASIEVPANGGLFVLIEPR